MSIRPYQFTAILLAFGATSCTEATQAKRPAEEKPPEAVTGRYAFYKMYPTAHMWAPDVQALRLSSISVVGLAEKSGKSGAWEATFVSPSKRMSRSYTYSVVESTGNLHQGVFEGFEEPFSGTSGQESAWPIGALKVDNDEALAATLAHSASYREKNPDKPMFYLLEKVPRYPDPAWRLVWGTSVSASDFSIYVDASTGKYLETLH